MKLKALWFMASICLSCSSREVASINLTYIESNWCDGDKVLRITRMLPTQAESIPNMDSINQQILLEHLVVDTDFNFFATVSFADGLCKNRRVLLDQKNGFAWHDVQRPLSQFETIGPLQPGQWYRIDGLLANKVSNYIFVDREGRIHKFKVNTTNY